MHTLTIEFEDGEVRKFSVEGKTVLHDGGTPINIGNNNCVSGDEEASVRVAIGWAHHNYKRVMCVHYTDREILDKIFRYWHSEASSMDWGFFGLGGRVEYRRIDLGAPLRHITIYQEKKAS